MTAYRWFERFRNGDESLKDEPKSGRPNKFDLTDLKKAIESDPALNTTNMAKMVDCTQGNIYYLIKQLGFVSKLSGWCPHDLNKNQLENRIKICKQLISSHRTFNWLDNLITGDEK